MREKQPFCAEKGKISRFYEQFTKIVQKNRAREKSSKIFRREDAEILQPQQETSKNDDTKIKIANPRAPKGKRKMLRMRRKTPPCDDF